MVKDALVVFSTKKAGEFQKDTLWDAVAKV